MQLIDVFSKRWDYDMEEHVRNVVINHMWEETFGNNHKHDGPSKGIEEEIPFEFKDLDNPIDGNSFHSS